MATKRRLRPQPSWPDRQLVWIERERSFARWMHSASARPWVLLPLNVVSRLGDGWMWCAVILALPWFSHPVGIDCAIRMAAVGAVDLVLYLIIKRCIARPRPYRNCPGIQACGRSLDEYSFPSGHTMHSVAFSLILSTYYPALGYIVWPFTALVGISRVVLGLHYPSDVVVGALVGGIMAAVSFNLL